MKKLILLAAISAFGAAPAPKALWRYHGQGHVTAFASTEVRQQLLQWLDQAPALPADSTGFRDLP